MSGDMLVRMIEEQLDLQVQSFTGDPRAMTGEQRAEFVRWNVLAACRELMEALEEHRWKPWLTDGSQGEWYDRDAFVREVVDAWHFVMNLLLTAAGPDVDPERVSVEFYEAYLAKRKVNAKRQEEGYDGVKDNGSGSGREVDSIPGQELTLNFPEQVASTAVEANTDSTWFVSTPDNLATIRVAAEHAHRRSGRPQRVVLLYAQPRQEYMIQ